MRLYEVKGENGYFEIICVAPIKHVRKENCTHSIESPNVEITFFPHTIEGLLLKERIILSFKRSPHFEKGCN